jgi:EpsI family protein
MTKTKNCLILLILLVITAGFVFIDRSLSKSPQTIGLDNLPLTLGEWQGKSFQTDERIMRILQTEYILDRNYTNSTGWNVYLSIVYYPDNKIGFHNPESCNTGAGSKIIRKDVLSITNGKSEDFKVNRLILERTQGNKVILYFFVSGNYITHDYLKFRLHMMRQQMGFRRPSGAQVQIHSAIGADPNTAVPILEDFIRSLAPLLPDYLS